MTFQIYIKLYVGSVTEKKIQTHSILELQIMTLIKCLLKMLSQHQTKTQFFTSQD